MSSGQTHSVTRHLDLDAHSYDVQIRRPIPYYDDMLATGVELLGALAPASGHVLDLGGGTGALSAAVLEGLAGVRVTVLDVDPDMLSEARRRLSGAWSGEDRYFPLEVELGALREAGFDEVECFWRRGASAITCALRAG